MGKGEIARNKQFLLFPQCFLLKRTAVSQFFYDFDIISLSAADFEKPKFGISGKGLRSMDNPLKEISDFYLTNFPIAARCMAKCHMARVKKPNQLAKLLKTLQNCLFLGVCHGR